MLLMLAQTRYRLVCTVVVTVMVSALELLWFRAATLLHPPRFRKLVIIITCPPLSLVWTCLGPICPTWVELQDEPALKLVR